MPVAPTADQAIAIARQCESVGWKPTPLHVVGPDGSTCTCPKGAACGKSAGKHNIAGGWQNDLRGSEIFVEMAQGAPKPGGGRRPPRQRMNVGILTGAPSGIVVLDIDVNSGGFESMTALVEKHGQLPDTFIVQTGTGGYHYYFAIPEGLDVRNSASKIADGIDIRGNGGMVVAPGSVSWAGEYRVVMTKPVAPMPDWLVAAVTPAAPAEARPPMQAGTAGESLTHVGSMQSAAAAPANPFVGMPDAAISAAPATASTATMATPANQSYANAIVKGELERVSSLATAGWSRPWDVETFQAACQLIELGNADWTPITVEQLHDAFIASCPPQEPGYNPEVKWTSALQRIGTKAREAPAPRQQPDDDAFDIVKRGGPPDPTQGGEGHREGAFVAAGAHSLTDLGNAERLFQYHGNVIRHDPDSGTWLTYNAGSWSDAPTGAQVETYTKSALNAAKRAEVDLHPDVPDDYFANGNPKPTPRERFWEWMMKSEMYARVQATVAMARSDPRLHAKISDFDADPMIFNAANCAVNLVTGEAIPHSPELMMRHQASTVYDPAATAPQWEAFLRKTQPDDEMREYLRIMLGYSITGRVDEQAFFVHNGTGSNGKSTFFEAIKATIGTYGQKLERETLMTKKGSGAIPADVARMAGKRLLMASESKAGGKFDDERIKELVGGDTQTARHLHKNFFEFDPIGKIHLATNHLPDFEGGGHGMGRRFRLVPWEVSIPDEEADRGLKTRLITMEASGILNWLVQGARQWAAQGGLTTPALVKARSAEHVVEADPVWPFIHERLDLTDPACRTEFQAVYGAYESWCNLNGNKPMSGKALSMALVERLGHEIREKDANTRRSVLKVKVNFMAVPTQHEAFFTNGARA